MIKRVSKACHDDVLYSRVETASAAIFSKAGCKTGVARNTTDPLWITAFCECFTSPGVHPHAARGVLSSDRQTMLADNATLGPDAAFPGGSVAGMPLPELVAAWRAPFASSDPKRGGCPSLPIPPAPPRRVRPVQ